MEKILIKPIKMGKITTTLVGVTPLLMDKFNEGALTNKEKITVEEEAENGKYLNSIGEYYIPAITIQKAMVEACRQTSMKMSEARGSFFVSSEKMNNECLLFDYPEPELHCIKVNLSRKGSAKMKGRSQFNEWKINIIVRFNAEFLTSKNIFNLLEIAGFGCGLLSWRPNKGGIYGQFKVTNFKEFK